MSGSVGDILENSINYLTPLLNNEFIQWFLAAFLILGLLGIFKKLLKINS